MHQAGQTNPVVGPVRGRGASRNPGNRFESLRLHVLADEVQRHMDEHPRGWQMATQSQIDSTRTLINRVDSPDLPFKWTINPYRGCEHGCIYCYARPTHEQLGYSCGLDFEMRIVAKMDAATLLRRELLRTAWRGEPIVMSGVTDAYQPIERRLRITRGCLELMAASKQPVSIITKNPLILRDMDLLEEMAKHSAVNVAISITTLDHSLARMLEPRAGSPAERLKVISRLSRAEIPVMVMVAPIIPALNDREIPRILEAAAAAGARSAGWIMLRLPYQVKRLFVEWLNRWMPDRAQHVISAIESVRGGSLSESRFGERMLGHGVLAEQIDQLFKVYAKRAGLQGGMPSLSSATFDPAVLDEQLRLFS